MAARARRGREERRRPTYGAGMRIARLVLELRDRPYGWAWDDACAALEVSERTLARYVAQARRELVDRLGRPILEVASMGSRRVLRFASRGAAPDANAYEAVSLFFTMALARFLAGTIFEQGTGNLLERLEKTVPPSRRGLLENLERKLFSLEHAPKDYREKDAVLDPVFRALLAQHRLAIDYGGLLGDARRHDFDPYTLLGYRGGLYLLGQSQQRRKIIWLAVDRIRAAEIARDAEGRPIAFRYPASFHPARYTNGMFGVVEGDATRVELAINNAETEAYLRERRIHPSQSFVRGADGRTRLVLLVRGTSELANWILGLCPYVEVIEPAGLRSELRERLRDALAQHQPAPHSGRKAPRIPR